MEITKKSRAGRPQGARSTEPSDLVFRVRSASGKSQNDFADELGCSPSAVSKFEQESRTPGPKLLKQRLAELAKKYKVEVSS